MNYLYSLQIFLDYIHNHSLVWRNMKDLQYSETRSISIIDFHLKKSHVQIQYFKNIIVFSLHQD